jgi:pyrroline-5-carboxylate reductase
MRNVVVIGVGAMGTALIAAAKTADAQLQISVTDKDETKVMAAIKSLNVELADDNTISSAELIVIAVKPQDISKVLAELNPKLTKSQTVLSIAAGVRLDKLIQLVPNATLVRCMPNTPALVGHGLSTLSVKENTDAIHLERATEFLTAAGKVMVIPEELQDSFTAIHGSGPAYVFLLIEALVAAAIAQGISETDATAAVIETVAGAAALIAKTGESASTLRERVTSPGGTTEAALNVFAAGGFSQLVAQAVAAAKQRAAELG